MSVIHVFLKRVNGINISLNEKIAVEKNQYFSITWVKIQNYPIIQSNDFPKAWPHIQLHNIYVKFN